MLIFFHRLFATPLVPSGLSKMPVVKGKKFAYTPKGKAAAKKAAKKAGVKVKTAKGRKY